ncbi:MAG: hypothetical protein QGH39_05975 [Candidatus Thermoplasmatota archaeon]|jgi:hypothetical protein|nr:hypothetical protein [Candidatus Thermoplasmatota archaeon]MDP7265091.1 hypothetical protein [Candidatus Thermoplasmatota archaeon]
MLSSLSTTGKEEKLRNRYVAELEKQEDRLVEMKEETRKYAGKIRELQDMINDKLRGKLFDRIKKFFTV